MAIINGTAENDTLLGTSGDDTINGLVGADIMKGGLGNDIYVVDNSGDVVVENAGEGTDTVQSSVSYTLSANVENLTLTGTANIDGTGNELANTLTGNSGINTLAGGAGDDTYIVQNAGDVVLENLNQGIDNVSINGTYYALGANVENLHIGFKTGGVTGIGNDLDNVITANGGWGIGYGNSDTIDGGAGADTMSAGAGNDTYYVDNVGDIVTENAGAGTDTIISSITYSLVDTDGAGSNGGNIENLTLSGTANIDGTGNGFNNVITGNSGINTLAGGLGDDTYVVQNSGAVVIENFGAGTDTVQSSVTYALAVGDNIENLTLTGMANINGTGNELNNTLTGNSGINTLAGGAGDDTYIVQNAGDVVLENLNQGIDNVSINGTYYALGANVENLHIGFKTGGVTGIGNDLDNVITANGGWGIGYGNSDTIDGGAGADTMSAGAGNDTYYVDNVGDVVIENAGEGTDTVITGFSYTLDGTNLENLTLTGTAALSGTGNASDNVLTGNNGNSTLIGGVGNDTYIVQNSNTVIIENAGEGTDTVQSSVSYTLSANIENLNLQGGSTAINGTGNDLDNVIHSDAFSSATNILAGGLGNDVYYVNQSWTASDGTFVAADTVVENAGEGIDTVHVVANWNFFGPALLSYTLSANVENLRMSTYLVNGFAMTAVGVGNDLDNILSVNDLPTAATSDTLDGGGGADTMSAGIGNDTYYVDNVGDVVVENAGEGTDTVISSISYTLADTLENLTLTGTAALNGTGNASDNVLTGNNGNSTLIGGVGNDTYIVQNSNTVIVENPGAGTDTIQSSVNYTLSANVENLTLTGSAALTGIGNSLDNILRSNSVYNTYSSDDTLIGGLGNDTYYVQADAVVENAGEGIDTVNAWNSTYTLSANVENLVIHAGMTQQLSVYGVGNDLNNNITSSGGNDTLDGGLGADTMTGRLGNDTYYVDNVGDVVIENAGEGIDTVVSSISYTLGGTLENLTLSGTANIDGTGNDFNNVITGNSGINTLTGGLGDDTYVVQNSGAVVIENFGAGTDTVQSSVTYALAVGDNIENLTLTGMANINGTGNELNNTLTGNSGINTLAGGAGDDTYIVQNAGDVVLENLNQGIDNVSINGTYYALGANVENLHIGFKTGGVTGIGNDLDNVITANGGWGIGYGNSDTIDGGAGADTMSAGAGNDTYYVDNVGDIVTENAGAGTDTIISSITYSLVDTDGAGNNGGNIENLTLSGSANINGMGNTLTNILNGNSAANALNGSAGSDTLTGGGGADIFVFDTALGTSNVDRITDFTHGSDSMQLALSIFSGIGATGALSATAFVSGAGMTAATTASEHIAYDTNSGMLYYDADGVGGAASVAFASLTAAPTLTATDITVV